MGGFEATQALRARERQRPEGPRVPVVAMTAHAMKGDRERCLAAGMDAYVSKPLRAEDLWKAIREVVPAAAMTPPGEDRPAGEPARGGFDRGEALERMGRGGDLTGAEEAYRAVEGAVQLLRSALARTVLVRG